MNKNVFIQELRNKLKGLPKEEMDNALGYYIEYFEDAGIDDEQDVLKELESPSNIASQILSDYAFKDDEIKIKKSKKGISSIWFVILAILAAPLALPLALTLIILVFTMVLVVGTLVFTFVIITVTLFGSGIFVSFAGAAVMTQSFSTSIMFIGIGLICTGLGLLIGLLVARLAPRVFRGIANFARKSLTRFKKSNG
ncbi:DUF1700 domain-containing protein [Clostridium frigidicarnis]|uniref:Uncharacterized membrane protein n=1 Tax=Clostridium frigidicarnis TaxID=84698 RepID=A0A1I0YGB6_9CLOT|nr:DUF1700 domain-containing protein [Clostridium frigidicarnis]SFB11398.1 Uncharacterized membrane protein [Clostridium frigidicarnis]